MEAAVSSPIMTKIVVTAARKKFSTTTMSLRPVMISTKAKKTMTIMTKGTTKRTKTITNGLIHGMSRKTRTTVVVVPARAGTMRADGLMRAAGLMKAAGTTRAGVRRATAAAMSAKITVVAKATAGVNLPVAGVSPPWTGIHNGGSPAKADAL